MFTGNRRKLIRSYTVSSIIEGETRDTNLGTNVDYPINRRGQTFPVPSDSLRLTHFDGFPSLTEELGKSIDHDS